MVFAATNERGSRSMQTFRQLLVEPPAVPSLTAWYIADVAEALGKQELYT